MALQTPFQTLSTIWADRSGVLCYPDGDALKASPYTEFILKKNVLFSIAAVVFLWVAWIIAYFIVQNDYLLPSFTETFSAMGHLLSDVVFWRAFGHTLIRTTLAFAVSLVLGVALALIANLRTWVRSFMSPIISALRTAPTMAIILVLLLWTTPRLAPAIVSLLVLLPAVYAATLTSLDEVTENYGALARAFRVSTRRKAFKMYLPLVAPSVLGQAGAIFSMGLKITISGEVLASTYPSLGHLMQESKMFVQMPELLALTILSVAVGFLLEALCLLAYKLIVRWRA